MDGVGVYKISPLRTCLIGVCGPMVECQSRHMCACNDEYQKSLVRVLGLPWATVTQFALHLFSRQNRPSASIQSSLTCCVCLSCEQCRQIPLYPNVLQTDFQKINYRYRIVLPEELVSITETDLWECQHKISHYKYRYSLEFQVISITDTDFGLETN